MFETIRRHAVTVLGVLLCLFTLFEVNYNQLQPQSALAVFVGLGLVICYLVYPVHPKLAGFLPLRLLDVLLAVAVAVCCGYVVVQTEPFFQATWAGGISLGNRAGIETNLDFAIGLIGLLLVLEATRRSIGWLVPALALLFVAHSYYCYGSQQFGWPQMPDWALPHAGQSAKDIVSTTYIQSLGVFGVAAGVMFSYVFLFVVFGTFLEMSGATQFIINFATRVFGRFRGGPAMVSVLASGLMGSLSGSAVANAVTTGAFTIPMMRSARFPRHIAGGITAAAASGGALVPPVMGAGAYMMLELIELKGGFLDIMQAAVIPATLFYISLLAIVFFYSRKLGAGVLESVNLQQGRLLQFEALVFFGALGVLIGLLILKFSPFKAVTGSLAVILVMATMRRQLKLGFYPRMLALASFFAVLLLHQATMSFAPQAPSWLQPFLAASWVHPLTGEVTVLLTIASVLGSAIVGMFGLLLFGLVHPAWRAEIVPALGRAAKNGIALVAASACVGIIIGIVQQTGIATDFSAAIKGVVETNLLLALVGIMVCSLILGMGVPSVVCYLLMATLMGSLLSEMGVPPLAAHMFIFYFGMMSMVTPPVALAGYASASIAEAEIMPTSWAAFRFSLVGFTLPYMFIYRPALLLLGPDGMALTEFSLSALFAVTHAVLAALFGIISLAAALAGYMAGPLSLPLRGLLFLAAAMLLAPITKVGDIPVGLTVDLAGAVLFGVVAAWNFWSRPGEAVAGKVPSSDLEAGKLASPEQAQAGE